MTSPFHPPPFNTLYKADQNIYITTGDGFAMLHVTDDLCHPLEEFVIHRVMQLHKGMYFNFSAISPSARITISFPGSSTFNMCFLSEPRFHTKVVRSMEVDELLAYFYNVRGNHFNFPETRQQCWELTYVDSGCLNTRVDGKEYKISANERMIFAPGQLVQQSTEDYSCSYLTIMFTGTIPAGDQEPLKNHRFSVSTALRQDLELFVHQAKNACTHSLLINAIEHLLLSLLSGALKPAVQSSSSPCSSCKPLPVIPFRLL